MDKTAQDEIRKQIAEYVARHPELTYKQIGDKLGVSNRTIHTIYTAAGYARRRRVGMDQLKALQQQESNERSKNGDENG